MPVHTIPCHEENCKFQELTKDWEIMQNKTFTKWLNTHMKKKGFPPFEDLSNEFEDGTGMMRVVNALYDVPIPKHKANPKLKPQKADNHMLAFAMAEKEAEIKFNFLKAENLMEHDTKMILGMVWSIILHHAINGINVDDLTAKEGLLMWVQKQTKGYRDVDPPTVKNFHKDWKNGMAFCALIHRHYPDLIDYDSLSAANAAENLELAFSVAEEKLDIPRLLDVEDMLVDKPDERSVMTQVSEYFHRFASSNLKESAARKMKNFIAFQRKLEELIFDYERRARAFIQWCGAKGEEFAQTNSFGETLEESIAGLAGFRRFIVEEKPQQLGEKIDVGSLFAEIQTELKINDRPPYVPPADVEPVKLEEAEHDLHSKEMEYAIKVRENRFRFVEKRDVSVSDEKKAEFKNTFDRFDADKSGCLNPVEFKACLVAIGIPFKEDTFHETFSNASAGQEKIHFQEFMNFMVAFEEDRDTPDSVATNLKLMADENGTITAAQLNCPPLDENDAAYLMSKMPEISPGVYDYNAYVKSTFGA